MWTYFFRPAKSPGCAASAPVSRRRFRRLSARLRAAIRRWLLPQARGVWLHCDSPAHDPAVPVPVSEILEITGWALSPHGLPAVTISGDGTLLGAVTRGCRRPDVARLCPHLRGAERSGFHYLLDTKRLPNGIREITLTAVSKDGQTARHSFLLDVRNALTDYDRWRRQNQLTAAAAAWMRRHAACLHQRPTVSLLLTVRSASDLDLLASTLASVRAQTYEDWELCLGCAADLRERLHARLAESGPWDRRLRLFTSHHPLPHVLRNQLLQAACGEWAGPLDAGDLLEPHALFEFVYHLNLHPDLDLIYSDEDVVRQAGLRERPFFKPDWSPDLLLSMNYLGRGWLGRKSLLEAVGGFGAGPPQAAEYDLLLKLSEKTEQIGHVRTVLYARRPPPQEPVAEGARVLQAALQRRGIAGRVVPGLLPSVFHVRRTVAAAAQVSILLHGAASAEELRRCLASLQAHDLFCKLEVIVLDPPNGPAWQGESRGNNQPTVVRSPADTSRAAALNQAAAQARGEYLLFLHPAEALSADWLDALLEHGQRPEVGVVGGKVLDVLGRIHEAGLFLVDRGVGVRHAFRLQPGDDPGTHGLASVQRNCSAVSAACLLVRRRLFAALGGFDEELAGVQRDTDLCLRVARHGLRVVWTPHAVFRQMTLCHARAWQANAPAYWTRWRALHERGDPYYNPNLTVVRDDFTVNEEPAVVTHVSTRQLAPEDVRRILVVKLDHLGDVLLSLPALRRLRELFPAAEVTALVGSWAKGLVENEPSVDRVLTFDFFRPCSAAGAPEPTGRTWRELGARLARLGFDLAIDLRREPETRLFLRLSQARFTAGFANGPDNDWLTIALPYHDNVARQRPRGHVASDLLQLVEAVGRACREVDYPTPQLAGPEAEAAEALLLPLLTPRPRLVVGIHPGSGRAIKCWPARHFAALAGLFWERLGATVVLFGSQAEVPLTENVLQQLRTDQPAVSLAGRLTVPQFLAALRHCDLFVGNDSGPTHMAAALGVPTLGVYAGTIDPAQWAPLGPAAAVLHRGTLCSPCYLLRREMCPYHMLCLDGLPVEKVWEAALRVLLPHWPRLRGLGEEDREPRPHRTSHGPAFSLAGSSRTV